MSDDIQKKIDQMCVFAFGKEDGGYIELGDDNWHFLWANAAKAMHRPILSNYNPSDIVRRLGVKEKHALPDIGLPYMSEMQGSRLNAKAKEAVESLNAQQKKSLVHILNNFEKALASPPPENSLKASSSVDDLSVGSQKSTKSLEKKSSVVLDQKYGSLTAEDEIIRASGNPNGVTSHLLQRIGDKMDSKYFISLGYDYTNVSARLIEKGFISLHCRKRIRC